MADRAHASRRRPRLRPPRNARLLARRRLGRRTDRSRHRQGLGRLPKDHHAAPAQLHAHRRRRHAHHRRARLARGNRLRPLPEHACLYDEAGGILIAGDQVLPRISPNVSLGVTEPNADPLGEWFASIAKLKTLPADLLVLPGHGDPFAGLHTRLDAMDREHRERLNELAVFLAEPRRAVDCFGRLFRRAIGPDVLGMATGEALAHLRRLEVEGRATRETHDGVWWWRAA
ncbi:MBL fold metallo-hydrolase [Sphingomonas sp. LR55]|uniref:MBL fold metallo-hydrolase n=1 Tax=Sphingomonas sp. LR55 TaxID=3050231 RepID=UPI002FE07B5C